MIDQANVNLKKIEEGVRLILEGIGEDLTRAGIQETPRRVAEMYVEVCGGLFEDPVDELKVIPTETHDEIVMVKDIPLFSLCEHHLLPFTGVAHIAYIPNEGVYAVNAAIAGRDGFTLNVENAGHAFDNHESEMFYDESAAKAAWAKTLAFLGTHLPTA